MLAFFVVCAFCGKEFQSLGRHSWRCKKRSDSNVNGPNGAINIALIDTGIDSNSRSQLKCCCGKVCKNMRGLKLHQRSCRITKDFDDTELFEEIFEDSNSDEDLNNDILLTDFFDLKPGVRLPKTEDQWKLANIYFQSTFSNLTFRPESIDANITFMNTTIYNYFRDTYGIIEDPVNTDSKINIRTAVIEF